MCTWSLWGILSEMIKILRLLNALRQLICNLVVFFKYTYCERIYETVNDKFNYKSLKSSNGIETWELLSCSCVWICSYDNSSCIYLLHFYSALCFIWVENVTRRILYVANRGAGRIGRGSIWPEEERGWGKYKQILIIDLLYQARKFIKYNMYVLNM